MTNRTKTSALEERITATGIQEAIENMEKEFIRYCNDAISKKNRYDVYQKLSRIQQNLSELRQDLIYVTALSNQWEALE